MKIKSTHILNTSTNLLGFCLIVLTSVKISNYSRESLIDEFTGCTSILLTFSSLFSFLSIRSGNEKLGTRYEHIADIIFLISLILVAVIIILISFNIIF